MSLIHVGLDWKIRSLAYFIPEQPDLKAVMTMPSTGKNKVRYEDCGFRLGRWLEEEYMSWKLPLTVQPVFWLENPYAGFLPGGKRNIRTAIDQALTVGGILALAPGEAHLVEHTVWKKEIVGSGSSSKSDCAKWLAQAHPSLSAACGGIEDLIDAVCIGLYGSVLAARGGV